MPHLQAAGPHWQFGSSCGGEAGRAEDRARAISARKRFPTTRFPSQRLTLSTTLQTWHKTECPRQRCRTPGRCTAGRYTCSATSNTVMKLGSGEHSFATPTIQRWDISDRVQPLPGERGPVAAERARVQLGESVAAARAADPDRHPCRSPGLRDGCWRLPTRSSSTARHARHSVAVAAVPFKCVSRNTRIAV